MIAGRRIMLASADENGLCEVKLKALSSSERHRITLKRSSDADEPEATFVLDHLAHQTQLKSGLRVGDILVAARLLRPGLSVPFVDVERELMIARTKRFDENVQVTLKPSSVGEARAVNFAHGPVPDGARRFLYTANHPPSRFGLDIPQARPIGELSRLGI